jgi:hypothetical protein
MPAGDGTGPMGLGRMTGRGVGFCAGFTAPGCMNPMPGRGRGMHRGWGRGGGRGQGRGWRHGYHAMGAPGAAPAPGIAPSYAAPSGEHEVQALRAQAEHLEGTVAGIRKRIAELEAAQGQEG